MIFKIISLLVFSHTLFAKDFIEHECDKILAKGNSFESCIKGIETIPINLSNKNLEIFSRWSFLVSKIEDQNNHLQQELNRNKDIFYYLRDGHVDENKNPKWFENEYQKILSDFHDLHRVMNLLYIKNKRLNMCFNSCSAYRRVELEKEIESLQHLKISLLAKSPILASRETENLITKKLEKNYNDNKLSENEIEYFKEDDIKKSLVSGYSTYLSTIKNKIDDSNRFINPTREQYQFSKNGREEVKDLRFSHFFEMINDVGDVDDQSLSEVLSNVDWQQEINDPVHGQNACHFYIENLRYLDKQKNIELVKDGVMFTAPFLLGPGVRLGAIGLRGVGLLKWGMRGIGAEKVIQASGSVLSGVYFLNSISDLEDKKTDCDKIYSQFQLSKNKIDYENYIECTEDFADAQALALLEVSVVGAESIRSLKASLNFAKSYDDKRLIYEVKDFDDLQVKLSKLKIGGNQFSETGLRLKGVDNDLYALNLTNAKKVDALRFVGDDYWNFVAGIYSKRLNLSQEEISSFVKSSRAMSDRTTLVLNTKANSTSEFRGGVALVTSKNGDELMPFEKATGFKVQREKGKRVAEIVRLTVDEKTGDQELMKKLMYTLCSSVKGEKDINKLYVYTSKVHGRLYKRLGIPMKEVHKTDRDIIYEINVNDIQAANY